MSEPYITNKARVRVVKDYREKESLWWTLYPDNGVPIWRQVLARMIVFCALVLTHIAEIIKLFFQLIIMLLQPEVIGLTLLIAGIVFLVIYVI